MEDSTTCAAPGTLSPGERARMASERGKRAYDALLTRFEQQVDPDGTLPPEERARRVEEARRAHFSEIGKRGGDATARTRTVTPPAGTTLVPVTRRRRAAHRLQPADWAHLWDQSDIRTVLSARDIGAVYRALQEFGVSQHQIAGLTRQSQPEVSEILNGRQVRDVTVLERICDGLGIPRPAMRVLDQAPGEQDAYSEKVTGADTPEGVDADMLRRHLIAYGGITLAGAPVDKLGELLTDLGVLDPAPLPSQLSVIHVAQVRDTTERLGIGDTHFADPEVCGAAAAKATRLLDVPGPEPVKRALQVAVAELHLEAGRSAFDAGRYRRALYHYAWTLELATAAGDTYLQVLALRYAGVASVEHGHPDDGLKMLQCAQVKAWDIPPDDRRAVMVAESGRAAAQACALEESAIALVHLGDLQAAVTHLGKARELWTPSHTDPFGDMDRPAARLELARGRLDVAEALAVASLRRWEGGRRLSRILTGTVLAIIHVRAGEQGGLQLAHDTITAVRRLHSVRVRRQLLPLADALDSRPGPDAQELARTARQLAA